MKYLINVAANSLVIILVLFSHNAHASFNDELGKIWESLGGESVTNGSHYYHGQKRGHYTMGSMYLAKKKHNRALLSITPPEINLDSSCYNQGVLNFGGGSFISGEDLKSKLQNIVQQAGMMFVYLGISSISPVIGETLQEVYSKLQELGGFLADECQASKQMMGFIGDKVTQHSETAKAIIAKYKTITGRKGDLSTAYGSFPSGKKADLDKVALHDERLILENVNLAWKAIEKLKIDNKELKEMMMTVSGTIIIKASKEDAGLPSFQYVSSKVVSTDILTGLLKGNKGIKVLSCSDLKIDSKCLDVKEEEITIKLEDSFEHKVAGYFEAFKTAIKEDTELDMGVQNFLARSGLPVYKIYDVLYQITNANPQYEQGIIVEIVAWNILYNYLSDMLKEVSDAANNLQISANEELKEFKKSIKVAQDLLNNYEMKDISRYKLQLHLVKRIESMEDAISDEISQVLHMVKTSH